MLSQLKTPEKNNKGDKKAQSPKSPQTPRIFTVPEIKAKMMASVEKVCFLNVLSVYIVTMSWVYVVRKYHSPPQWNMVELMHGILAKIIKPEDVSFNKAFFFL